MFIHGKQAFRQSAIYSPCNPSTKLLCTPLSEPISDNISLFLDETFLDEKPSEVANSSDCLFHLEINFE
jgi:hypothetical protein